MREPDETCASRRWERSPGGGSRCRGPRGHQRLKPKAFERASRTVRATLSRSVLSKVSRSASCRPLEICCHAHFGKHVKRICSRFRDVTCCAGGLGQQVTSEKTDVVLLNWLSDRANKRISSGRQVADRPPILRRARDDSPIDRSANVLHWSGMRHRARVGVA